MSELSPALSPSSKEPHSTPATHSARSPRGLPLQKGPKETQDPSTEEARTPLAHADVAKLHKPLENSASFGETSFMNNLTANSLLGDDLIAMFNERSDAVKKELGLSQTSLASNSPGSHSPATSSSPHPPRAASCADFRSSARPESPLVKEGTVGRVRRSSGSTALGNAVSYMYGNGDTSRRQPSPSESPVQLPLSTTPLNMRALLGQSTPSGSRASPDALTSPSSSSHRLMVSRHSTGVWCHCLKL